MDICTVGILSIRHFYESDIYAPGSLSGVFRNGGKRHHTLYNNSCNIAKAYLEVAPTEEIHI